MIPRPGLALSERPTAVAQRARIGSDPITIAVRGANSLESSFRYSSVYPVASSEPNWVQTAGLSPKR
jgi:hypothetical protein